MSDKSGAVKHPRKPTIAVALVPVIFLLVTLTLALFKWNVQPHMPVIFSAAVTSLVGIYLGHSWHAIESCILETLKKSFQACLILYTVGILISIWIMSGTVPAMIYYGLQVINPKFFLVITTLVCCVVSVSTGSSWTTAGTVGLAFTGIGAGLGMPPAMVAGAIVSGAYFGDKMSPLSDTTNLAPAVAECDMFDHIRHMVYTTTPALILSLIIYLFLGLKYGGKAMDTTQIDAIVNVLHNAYNINILLMIPPVLVVLMVIKKVPALPGLFGGIVLGIVFWFVFQRGDGSTLDAVGQMVQSLHYGVKVDTGNELVDKLLSRGGYNNMNWTISLIVASMCFGGAMEITGCLEVLTQTMMKHAKGTGGLVFAVLCSSLSVDVISGSQYLSIFIPGRMFRLEFRRRGLHPKNLSRCLEDMGTLASPLIPWNTGGAFMYQTLGVNPFVFLPYAFLNWITPIVSLIYGITGFTMEKLPPEEIEKIRKEEQAKKSADGEMA